MKRRIVVGSIALGAIAVAVAIFVLRPGASTAEITPEVRKMIEQTAASTDLSVEELEAAYVAGLELADKAGAAGTMGGTSDIATIIAKSCATGIPGSYVYLRQSCSWAQTRVDDPYIADDLCLAFYQLASQQYLIQCSNLGAQ